MGVDAVSLDFRRIHWSPVVNSRGDLGTDLFVQVRDERRFNLGLMIGVQAKAGPRWFEQPVYVDHSTLIGWWFYEPHKRHFDDWVEHGLPHLVVLHDLDKRCSYWVHVTAANVESTGQGCKVLVPVGQTIDAEHAEDLVKVAATMRQGVSLQGTAWSAQSVPIGPGSLLRHAMIAPRLVAPHRNTQARGLSPEQAVALIVQGRHGELDLYVESIGAVPSMDDAKTSSDWRWQLVAAMWQYTTAGDRGELADLAGAAPSAPQRAAGAVAAACAAMDNERFDEAIEILSGSVEKAEPVDSAWLLAQRARVRADLGQVADARQDAARAQRCVLHASVDVTAAAIRAAAGQLLFQTSAWSDRSVGTLVEESDTAVSWWRGETMAAGLVAAAEQQFGRYADNSAIKIGGEDVANNRLFAVQLSAHLTGEHGTWRSAASLLGQHALMFWTPESGSDRYVGALDDLRRTGDRKNLKLAAMRTWCTGPVAALADATRRIHDAPWTHTTTGTNLLLWKYGGDVLPANMATAAANRCLDILGDRGALTAVALPFRLDSFALQGLAGLLHVADDAVHRRAVEFFASLPANAGPGEVQDVTTCITKLRATAVTDKDLARLRDAAGRIGEPHLPTMIIGELARFDPASRQQLVDQIAAGDVAALRAFSGDKIPRAAAAMAVQVAAVHTDIIVEQARAHSFADRDWDPLAHLAWWSCQHSDVADWGTLLRALAEPMLPGQYKRLAYLNLAVNLERVPDAVRADLQTIVLHFAEPPNPLGALLGRPMAGVATYLAVALGALDPIAHADAVSRLLSGAAQERRDFIRYIGVGDPIRYGLAMVALLGDADVQVRAEAANGLARAATKHDDPVVRAAVRRAASDPGALVPMAVVAGLSAPTPIHDDLVTVLGTLQDHLSAKVRKASRDALDAGAQGARVT